MLWLWRWTFPNCSSESNVIDLRANCGSIIYTFASTIVYACLLSKSLRRRGHATVRGAICTSSMSCWETYIQKNQCWDTCYARKCQLNKQASAAFWGPLDTSTFSRTTRYGCQLHKLDRYALTLLWSNKLALQMLPWRKGCTQVAKTCARWYAAPTICRS